MNTTRKYGRDDVCYESWYGDWSKRIAKEFSKQEIEKKLRAADSESRKAAKSHFSAIQKTHSMQSNSQRRAQTGNVLAASGEYKAALSGALEIHELFPEHAKTESIQHEPVDLSIHSCSYYCHRPDCIKAQRDELRDAKYLGDYSELISLLHEDIRIIKKYMLARHGDVFGGLVSRIDQVIAALQDAKREQVGEAVYQRYVNESWVDIPKENYDQWHGKRQCRILYTNSHPASDAIAKVSP